jgi:hypothetical protein
MSCDHIRRSFLDHDWDEAALHEAVAMAEHLARCEACREAVGQYDTLRQLLHVSETVPELDDLSATAKPHCSSGVRLQRIARWAGSAMIAASLLIAIAGWSMYFGAVYRTDEIVLTPTPQSRSPMPNANSASPSIRLTEADMTHNAAVFQTVSETFEGRTGWVAIAGQSADLGLLDAPPPRSGKVLLLRIVVSRNGSQISNTDLMVLPGQTASLDVPFESGQILHYTVATSAGADQRLAIWAEVRMPGEAAETLASLATTRKPVPGRAFSAGRLVTSYGGYDLEIVFSERNLGETQTRDANHSA